MPVVYRKNNMTGACPRPCYGGGLGAGRGRYSQTIHLASAMKRRRGPSSLALRCRSPHRRRRLKGTIGLLAVLDEALQPICRRSPLNSSSPSDGSRPDARGRLKQNTTSTPTPTHEHTSDTITRAHQHIPSRMRQVRRILLLGVLVHLIIGPLRGVS